jgi:hypothetical protein
MSKWIRFEHYPPKSGHTTSIWIVMTKESDVTLGIIKWLPRWRKYAFFPANDTVYEPDCLRDLADFIKERMEERR